MPGKIVLHTSPNFAALVRKIAAESADLYRQPGSSAWLVGEVERAVQLRKKHLLQTDGAVATALPFITRRQFLAQLFENLELPAVLLPFRQRLFLLSEAAESLRPQLKKFNFPDDQIPVGTLRGLLAFFEEIRLQNADNTLLKESPGTEFGRDLRLLFQGYLEILGDTRLDEAGFLEQLSTGINTKILHNSFPELRTLIWENVADFRQAHLKLIARLSELNLQQSLLLPYGGNEAVFANRKPLFLRLKKMADETISYEPEEGLHQSLFRLDGPTAPGAEKYSVFAARHQEEEVHLLAGEIRRLVTDEHLRHSQIAIVCPAPEAYRTLLENTFNRHCIPFTYRGPIALRGCLPLQHFMELTRLSALDYPLEGIIRLLNSPFLRYHSGLQNISGKQILNRLRIRSGRRAILRQVKELSANIQEYLLPTLEELFTDAAFFSKSHSPDKIVNFVTEFFNRHKIANTLASATPHPLNSVAEEHLAAVREFFGLLHIWRTFSSATQISPARLHQVLDLIISTGTAALRRPREFGVQILPLPAWIPEEFHTIFIPGMEEGVFPGMTGHPISGSTAFPDEWRTFLPDSSIELHRERFLNLLLAPASRIRFSYPVQRQNNPVLPSFFLRELERICERSLNETRNIHLLTTADFLTRLQAEGDWRPPESVSPLVERIPPQRRRHHRLRLEIIRLREDTTRQNVFSGWPGEDALTAAWLAAHFRSAAFSPTQLEEYAACPMIYQFRRLLHLEPAIAGEEIVSPLDRGQLMHNVLFRFFLEYPEEKRTLNQLKCIAEEELQKIPVNQGIFWELEKQFLLGSPGEPGLLEKFWKAEQDALAGSLFRPRFFEFAFGTSHLPSGRVDPASTSDPFRYQTGGESFYFQGKIDRVETTGDGTLLVVDYKTGRVPNLSDIREGRHLQLPLYLAAIHDHLTARGEAARMGGGAIYELRDEPKKSVQFWAGDVNRGGLPVPRSRILPGSYDPLNISEFVERTLNVAAGIIREISAGHFPHTSDSRNCRRHDGRLCDFISLCRVGKNKPSPESGPE